MTVRRDVTAGGRWIDRRTAAALVTASYFPTTKRAIERWPIAGKLVNGKFMMRERDVCTYVELVLNFAPAAAPLRR